MRQINTETGLKRFLGVMYIFRLSGFGFFGYSLGSNKMSSVYMSIMLGIVLFLWFIESSVLKAQLND